MSAPGGWARRLARGVWRAPWVLALFALALAGWAAFEWTLASDWFAERLRQEVRTRAEQLLGGEIDVETVEFDRADWSVVVRGVTARAAAGAEPFARIPEAHLGLGYESLFEALRGRGVALRSLVLVAPELRAIRSADGASNLPARPRLEASGLSVDLRVLSVRDAAIAWNDEPRRFAIEAAGVHLVARPAEAGECVSARATQDAIALTFAERRVSVRSFAGRFELCQDRLEVAETSFAAEGARVEASGEVEDFAAPRVSARYTLEGPLAAGAALAPAGARLPVGAVRLSGEASWNAATNELLYKGEASVDDVRFPGAERGLSPGSLRTRYEGDAAELRLEDIDARFFGGAFSGSARVDDPFGERRVGLDGEVEGFRLQPLIRAAAEMGGPDLRVAPWTAIVRARVRARARTAGGAAAEASVRLEAAGERPVSGDVEARYDFATGRIELPRVSLETAEAKLGAEGSWLASGAALDLRWASTRSDDLRIALTLLGIPIDKLPVEPRGAVDLEGRLDGRIAPAGSRDFEFAGRVRTGAVALLGYEWDSLSTDLLFREDLLRLSGARLTDGPGTAELSFEADLAPGRALSELPIRAQVRARNLSAEKALAAGRMPEIVSGRMDAEAEVAGVAADPDLRATAMLRDGVALGQRFDSLAVRAEALGGALTLERIEFERAGGRLTGSGDYRRETREFHAKVAGERWRVDDLGRLLGAAWPLGGLARLELRVEGRLPEAERRVEQLRADGSWSVENLSWGAENLGEWSGGVSTREDTVRLDWSGAALGGAVRGEAAADLVAGKLGGTASFEAFDVAQAARLANLPLDRLDGRLRGSLEFSAPLDELSAIEIEGAFDQAELRVARLGAAEQGYELYNPFPMRWAIRGRSLELEHMRLQGAGTDIEVDGDIGLDAPGTLDVDIEGVFNLAALESLRGDLRADGEAVVNVKAAGTVADPQIVGRVRVRNGVVRSEDFPNGLSGLSGDIAFSGRDLRIDELTALSGGGRLRFSGAARWGGESSEYRFNADVDRVRLRFPESVGSVMDGQLALTGARGQGLLSGELLVRRANTNPQSSLGDLIAALREPSVASTGASWLESIQMNVHVASGPDFAIETSLVRNVAAEVDLRLVGTPANPGVLGRIGIDAGEMNFHGSRYTINRGEIAFVNPFRIEPVLDFEFETRIRDVDIGLILAGPARRLNVSYRSDPPLSFSDLVNLVAVGRAPVTDPVLASQQRVQQQGLFQVGATSVFEQAMDRPVSPGLQRFFGVSRLKVDPQAGGAEANPAARISTEQRITNDVTLIYTYDLSSTQQQTFRLEYTPNRRWTFLLTRDQNGLVGSDVLYKTRRR